MKAFKKHFKIKTKHKDDPLVKAGGMQQLLATFFKQNKNAYKAFMKHHNRDATEKASTVSGKKRKRATSDISEVSKPEKRKRVNSTISAKSAKSEKSDGPVTRSMD